MKNVKNSFFNSNVIILERLLHLKCIFHIFLI